MEITISRSTQPGKKYQATSNGRTVHFGAAGYTDFTRGAGEERRARYIKRHKKNEDWSRSNLMSAGFLARHVLWEEPTVRGALEKLNKKYKDVKFVLK
jgi:hypothetical protein